MQKLLGGDIVELFLWDNYSGNKINEKVKYWVDIWEDLINNYNTNSYGLNLFNVHTIINDIIDEVKYNKMNNKENKKYLLQKIDYFIKNDLVINKNYIIEFKIIREYLNSDNIQYLLVACQKIHNIFDNGSYVNKTYDRLIDILLDEKTSDIDYNRIKEISQSIIVELLIKGYSLKTISKLAGNVFKSYTLYGEDCVVSDFPHEIKYSDFNNNRKEYNKAIVDEISNLSLEDRLNAFKIYLNKHPVEYLAIFQVEGLTGHDGITIGDVDFYYPKSKMYIDPSEATEDEECFYNKNKNIMNAAVKIRSVDYEKGIQLAIDKTEKAFDVVQCFYKSKLNLKVIKERYIITDKNRRILQSGSYSSEIQEILKNQYSRNVDFINKDQNTTLILNQSSKYLYEDVGNQSFTEQKIVYSLHWFRKAEDTEIPEDKLLNYWIAIENLMDFKEIASENNIFLNKGKETKFNLACEIIPCIELISYKNNVCKELYRYITYLIGYYSISCNDGTVKYGLEIPAEIQEKCRLNTNRFQAGEYISLTPFVENLTSLLACTNRKVISDKINYANKFYTELDFAENEVNERIKQVQDDILCIYRYRNKIVHNAQYDYTMLPYYVAKSKKYANSLLAQVLYEYSISNKLSLQDIFVKLHLNKKIFLERLKSKAISKLIDYDINP